MVLLKDMCHCGGAFEIAYAQDTIQRLLSVSSLKALLDVELRVNCNRGVLKCWII